MAIQAVAAGCLLKDSHPLGVHDAIQEVHAGGLPMTTSIARRVIQYFREIKKNQETSGLNLSVLTTRPKTSELITKTEQKNTRTC